MFSFTPASATPTLPSITSFPSMSRKESAPNLCCQKKIPGWLRIPPKKYSVRNHSHTLYSRKKSETPSLSLMESSSSNTVSGVINILNISKAGMLPPAKPTKGKHLKPIVVVPPATADKENAIPSVNVPPRKPKAVTKRRTVLRPLGNVTNLLVKTHTEGVFKADPKEKLVSKYMESVPLTGWNTRDNEENDVFEML